MSGYLATLLDREKLTLKSMIERFESASGQNAVDARLTSELIVKAKTKELELGLDPADTTAAELHQALLNMAGLHDKFLSQAIGCSDPLNSSEILPKIAKFASSFAGKKSIWAIKHSVAKRLLKQNPPLKLMKQLGYRSVDFGSLSVKMSTIYSLELTLLRIVAGPTVYIFYMTRLNRPRFRIP